MGTKVCWQTVGTLSPVKYITNCKKVFTSAKSVPFCETQTWHHDTYTLTNIPSVSRVRASRRICAETAKSFALADWLFLFTKIASFQTDLAGWINKLKGLWFAVVNSFAQKKTTWLKIVFIFGGMQNLQKLQLHTFPSHILFSAQQNELMSIL